MNKWRFVKVAISIFVLRWIQLQNKSALWAIHGYSKAQHQRQNLGGSDVSMAAAEADCSPGLPWKLKIQQDQQLDPLLRKPDRLATTITMVTREVSTTKHSTQLQYWGLRCFSGIGTHISPEYWGIRILNSELGMLVSWKESSHGFWWTRN